ncbi:beta-phosphoglucomutase [Phaeocystidibacter luteus]|uniref:Beta-phosphoglucomutase n=1 Tax=Phaeocystidibacter luteus TaxID=911197 RepID=A0A6N6RHI6_9FLAO|nr:beta-phosphoglucomutase [Phaeocystidibacter luteus]KAB2813835.1 beta-phosphoglucomutase [Phaeocystidibacter luteus]
MIEGIIFDLDGVIVDTAKYHFQAWKRMAAELGVNFTEVENEQLKGVSRRGSIDKILNWGGISLSEEEIEKWMRIKNEWYLEYVAGMQPSEILPGADRIIAEAKSLGLKVSLGSASKNSRFILEKVNLIDQFDAIVDGTVVSASKPDPEVFLTGAKQLGLEPSKCLVFEDAVAGVQAANNGNMKVIGVGDSTILAEATLTFPNLENVRLKEDIIDKI